MDVRLGHQAHKVVVSDQVLRVETEMMTTFSLVAGRVVARRGHICFDTKNWLDTRFPRGVIEGLERK